MSIMCKVNESGMELSFTEITVGMNKEELMLAIVIKVANELENSKWDRLLTRHEVNESLIQYGFDEEFINKFDALLELLFMFMTPVAVVKFLNTIYENHGVKVSPDSREVTKQEFINIYNSFPSYSSDYKMSSSNEQVILKNGVISAKQSKENRRTGGKGKCKCILREASQQRESTILDVPVFVKVKVDGKEIPIEGTLVRMFGSRARIEFEDYEDETFDTDKVFFHERFSNAVYNVEDWYDAFESSIPEEADGDYPVMWHSNYGKVQVIGNARDEFGQDVVIIKPVSFDGISYEGNNLKYNVSDDEAGDEEKFDFKFESRPMTCYNSELIDLNSLKPEYKNAITKLYEEGASSKMYQAFSVGEMVDTSSRRDRTNKIIKGSEKNEETSPVASTLNEYLHIVAPLPRIPVVGDYAQMYHPQVTAARSKAMEQVMIDGRLDKSKLVFPKIPLGKVTVEPITEPVTVDGVTTYKAKITDGRVAYKNKKVVKGKKEWVDRLSNPVVLAIGAETGKMYITPAWWLSEISAPEELEVEIPVYSQVGRMPKKVKKYVDMAQYYKKDKDVKVKLNLRTTVVDDKVVPVNLAHMNYFNALTDSKTLKYKFVDPKTKEVAEAPATFVYNPIDEDYASYKPTADLITAGSYKPDKNANQGSEEQHICEEEAVGTMTWAELMNADVDETPSQEEMIASVIKQIKELGIDSVEYKLTKDVKAPGVVTICQKGGVWDFPVVAGADGYRISSGVKCSETAKSLFVQLIKTSIGLC